MCKVRLYIVNISSAFQTGRVLLSAAVVVVVAITVLLLLIYQKKQQLDLLLLHWLPARQRIEFKLPVLVYKAMNGLSPQYLLDDCQLNSTTG